MNISRDRVIISCGPEDTWQSAAELVGSIEKQAADKEINTVLALHGNLGSGKTCFVQGLAMAMGISQAVTSPTFTIVNEYKGRLPLYHIDLYRLQNAEEAMGFGFEEYLEATGITAVEWAERAGDLIPETAIHINFETLPEADTRKITIKSFLLDNLHI
jgi:tRNA threonylcarbamoyladenosine biosynthesis protein TsaE